MGYRGTGVGLWRGFVEGPGDWRFVIRDWKRWLIKNKSYSGGTAA